MASSAPSGRFGPTGCGSCQLARQDVAVPVAKDEASIAVQEHILSLITCCSGSLSVAFKIISVIVNRKWTNIVQFDKNCNLSIGLATKTPVRPAKAENPSPIGEYVSSRVLVIELLYRKDLPCTVYSLS